MKVSTKALVRAGIIASLYVVLSLASFPVASGAIQFRLSEALCVLPLVFIESVPALAVGCFLTNLMTGCAVFDGVFGGLITFFAGALTYLTGKIITKKAPKIIAGGFFPIALNALFLPLIWIWCYGVLEYAYWIQVAFLLISQSVSIYLLGSPVYLCTLRLKNKGLKFLE